MDPAQNFFDGIREPPFLAPGQSEFLQQREKLRVFVEFQTFDQPGAVTNNAERSFGGNRWVELFQRPGRCVPRICKFRQARFATFRIQFREPGLVQVRFPAHFENFRHVAFQLLRHGPDRQNILGNVVTDRSVAARRCVTQMTVFVEQRNRHAVDLRLDDDRDFLVRQQPLEPPIKIRDLFFRIGVVETQHRDAMRDLAECFQRLIADLLRRRIRRRQLRELLFEILQLAVKRVVLAIADRRRRLLVIAAVMSLDLAPQMRDSLRSFLFL